MFCVSSFSIMILLNRVCSRAVKQCRYHSTKDSKLPILTLFTKEPCSLCDIAKEAISLYSNRFQMQTVDITLPENEHWWKQYKYDIPVFHFEGKFLMKHKANISALKSALEAYEKDSLQ